MTDRRKLMESTLVHLQHALYGLDFLQQQPADAEEAEKLYWAHHRATGSHGHLRSALNRQEADHVGTA